MERIVDIGAEGLHVPDKSEIHVLTFTDKRYESIVRFSSQRRKAPAEDPMSWPSSDPDAVFCRTGGDVSLFQTSRLTPHPA